MDSCSDVRSDLLDAMERDLTMEMPRRRVKRSSNKMFSSEDEHRHIFSSDDELLIPSSRVDPHERVTQPPSGLLPTWVDEPMIPSICEADRTGILSVSDDERLSELCGSMAVAVPASESGRDCGRVAVVEPARLKKKEKRKKKKEKRKKKRKRKKEKEKIERKKEKRNCGSGVWSEISFGVPS